MNAPSCTNVDLLLYTKTRRSIGAFLKRETPGGLVRQEASSSPVHNLPLCTMCPSLPLHICLVQGPRYSIPSCTTTCPIGLVLFSVPSIPLLTPVRRLARPELHIHYRCTLPIPSPVTSNSKGLPSMASQAIPAKPLISTPRAATSDPRQNTVTYQHTPQAWL